MPSRLIRFYDVSCAILVEASGWVVLSLVVAGLLHEFLQTGRIRQHLNRPGIGATWGAVGLGGVLPVCSCGVIPIAVGLYRSGIRLGPVMAFAAATPIINPAAVLLSLAMLGPQLTLAYVALGLLLPFLLGQLCERFGGQTTVEQGVKESVSCVDLEGQMIDVSVRKRIKKALRWGLFELGPSIGFYLLIGILLAALIQVFIPPFWMDRYLGGNSFWGLPVVALLGASIYVCAVAHIPLVAALLAAGAGPGAAIVYLVTGTATNLPELFTLYKTIGRRTVLLYTASLIAGSLIAGVLVNYWLGADFAPPFNPLANLNVGSGSACWTFTPLVVFNIGAAYVVGALAILGVYTRLRNFWAKQRGRDCCAS